MATYYENVEELNKLLGKNFMNSNRTAQHPLRQSLARVLEFQRDNDYFNWDYENGAISLLVKNLNEIEVHDRKLLKILRKTLKNSNDDTYFGIRLEISVAASLIRNNTPFSKNEHPDFILHGMFEGASIECGSAHLSKAKLEVTDLKYKIGAVINDKSEYDYCNAGLALFIDFTNINYYSLLNDSLIGNDELKSYVREMLVKTNIGSVLLWTFMINKDLNRYQLNITNLDYKIR